MPINLPVLTLHETAVAVAACARAGRVPLVIGPPGVGKTSLGRAIAPMVGRAMGYEPGAFPAIDCILSNREAVDIGGYPVTLPDGTVEQKLFGTLRYAAENPCCLILDEFTTCPQSVQGPALRLTLEGYAGETPLHEHTRIVCMANPPDQAPGGIQMTAALVNRLVILHCRPSVQEIAAYFCARPESSLVTELDLPDEETWLETRARLMDVAGILFETRPDMLCFDPPQASLADGEPFASPRAWEICCDVLAALPAAHLLGTSTVCQALVMGSIGTGAGLSYLGILKARHHLPSVKDLLEKPDRAILPDEDSMIPDPHDPRAKIPVGRDVTFAAIPLVIEAARIDTSAAWVYVGRLPEEIQAAVAKSMTVNVRTPADSKWRDKGREIFIAVTKRLTQPATDLRGN